MLNVDKKKVKNIFLLVSIILVIVVFILIFADFFLRNDILKSPQRTGPHTNMDAVLFCDLSCGDGCVKPHEGCDDGNSNNGDGCSSICEVETDWGCLGAPSECFPLSQCLNGVLDSHETDIDCGGPLCGACEEDFSCDLDSDCISNFCDAGLCKYIPTTLDTNCKQIQFAKGYVENHVNVIFVGDDYDHSTPHNNDFGYTKFIDEVNRVSGQFLNLEPFTNAENINMFYVDNINTDLECGHVSLSGNSDCSSPNSGSWNGNDCRIIICSGTKVNELASTCPNTLINSPNEEIIVLFNSDLYGGSGGSYSIITHHPLSTSIATHEFGHSFGHLTDEYISGSSSSAEPSAYNCNLDSACPKWSDFLGNPLTPDVGCYSGCKYSNVKKGTYSSMMETLSLWNFKSINERILSCRLKADTNKFPTYADLFRDSSMMDLDLFCSLIPFGTDPPGFVPPVADRGYDFMHGATEFTFIQSSRGDIILKNVQRKSSAIYPDLNLKKKGDIEFSFETRDKKFSVYLDDFKMVHAPIILKDPTPELFSVDVSEWKMILPIYPTNLKEISYTKNNVRRVIDISAIPAIQMSSSSQCANCQTSCGDDEIQVPNEAGLAEDCEGTNLNGQTCQNLGFPSGTLSCSDCSFDTSGCQPLSCDPHTDNGDGTCTAEFIVSDDGYVENIGTFSWNYIHDGTLGTYFNNDGQQIFISAWSINDAHSKIGRGFMQFPYDLAPAANFISAELETRFNRANSVTFQDSELYILVGNQNHPLTATSYYDSCSSTTGVVSSSDVLGVFPFSGINVGISSFNIFSLDISNLESAITSRGDAIKICFRIGADALNNYFLTEYPNPDLRIYSKELNGAILRITYDFI
jgi:cysteine-rich repeat protein